MKSVKVEFNRNRNDEQVDAIREEVECFEYRVKKRAEVLEQMRLLHQEAKLLE